MAQAITFPGYVTLLSLSGLSGARGATARNTFTVAPGTSSVTVVLSGGTGDADLYVRVGSAPTTSAYTCRPHKEGNDETCTFRNPQAGTWHIGVRGYTAYSGASLIVTSPQSSPTASLSPAGEGRGEGSSIRVAAGECMTSRQRARFLACRALCSQGNDREGHSF